MLYQVIIDKEDYCYRESIEEAIETANTFKEIGCEVEIVELVPKEG